jgi:hypothetical protein
LSVANSNLSLAGNDVVGIRLGNRGDRRVLDVIDIHFNVEIHGARFGGARSKFVDRGLRIVFSTQLAKEEKKKVREWQREQ